jgi:hypothetical protein
MALDTSLSKALEQGLARAVNIFVRAAASLGLIAADRPRRCMSFAVRADGTGDPAGS